MGDRSARRIAARKKRLLQRLPTAGRILRGSLLRRFRKCGRPNCRCAEGAPHGPNYYLTVRRKDGSTTTVPVPADLLQVVKEYLANRRRIKEIQEKLIDLNLELLRRKELS